MSTHRRYRKEAEISGQDIIIISILLQWLQELFSQSLFTLTKHLKILMLYLNLFLSQLETNVEY